MTRDPDPATGPAGALSAALAAAANLLSTQPALAAQRLAEVLKDHPHHPQAILLLGAAHHRAGDAASAVALLEPLAAAHSGSPFVFYELGLARGALRHGDAAVAALRRAVELKPDFADAWRALADHLGALGDIEGADAAHARHLRYATRDPQLLEAGAAMAENRTAQAEIILRARLRQQPADVVAMRMLAEVAARLGRHGDSAALLAQCLELDPDLTAARYRYAAVLNRLGRGAEALAEVEKIVAREPANAGYRSLKAAILGRIGDYARAIEVYEGLLAEYPLQPNAWMSLGHALRSAGRRDDAIRAYRRSAELRPEFGEAWWSLANLKTFDFAPSDLTAMQAQLARPELGPADRYHFHFALGAALEARGDWGRAFSHYESGNRLHRSLVEFGPEHFASQVHRYRRLFSAEFFSSRAGFGAAAADPIFIVGMPRSGSTLVEQILSSHPAIEGTMELPNVIGIARALAEREDRPQSAYPEVLATLDGSEFRALGERYLGQTRVQRKTGAPFFVDKMPNNFAHIGLIHLMLPNARIIDARRHPVACCFSAFKQHFPRGQHFTTDLAELGRYYRDYVELLAHFDAVLPGRIHRVIYERMIDDTELEIRRLLEYCGLPFEPACLRFHENARAVRTASSEQVRRPIYREAVDYWRHFEPWLAPLKEALGPVLPAYPAVPAFD